MGRRQQSCSIRVNACSHHNMRGQGSPMAQNGNGQQVAVQLRHVHRCILHTISAHRESCLILYAHSPRLLQAMSCVQYFIQVSRSDGGDCYTCMKLLKASSKACTAAMPADWALYSVHQRRPSLKSDFRAIATAAQLSKHRSASCWGPPGEPISSPQSGPNAHCCLPFWQWATPFTSCMLGGSRPICPAICTSPQAVTPCNLGANVSRCHGCTKVAICSSAH